MNNFNSLLNIVEYECYCSFPIFMENYGKAKTVLLEEIKDLSVNDLRKFVNNYI